MKYIAYELINTKYISIMCYMIMIIIIFVIILLKVRGDDERRRINTN